MSIASFSKYTSYVTLFLTLNSIASIVIADDLLSRDDYFSAKSKFTDVPDQSVFDALFAHGNKFDFVVVESNDGDEGDVVHVNIKKRKFILKSPTAGSIRASFKQHNDNKLRIYWRPGLVFTYHAACGSINGSMHCGLMDENRMAWGFSDPRK